MVISTEPLSVRNVPKLTAEQALALFGSSQATPDERSDALTLLITTKFLPKQAENPAVLSGRQQLRHQAATDPEPGYRLLGIAELIRLSQVVKRWASEIAAELKPLFDTELPAMSLLANADDRLNLARACALVQQIWMPAYLSQSIAEEEAGERARAEMMCALLSGHANLTQVFQALTTSFCGLRPATEAPGDTVARRLTRTLSTCRDTLLDGDQAVGDGLGVALHALVSEPLATIGRPQEDKVRSDLSREALLLVHDLVRSRISLVADPTIYKVVAYCRRLCGTATWPSELKPALDRLIIDVSEALVLLGRQGQCDQLLLEQLDVLCDHPERAKVLARQLAANHPELPEDVRDWLQRGRRRVVKAASDAAVEAAASNADEAIGQALLSARQARQLGDSLREPLAASLDLYEPALAPATKELVDRLSALAVQVEHTARLRNLNLYGTSGEEVEMSTKFFSVITGAMRQRMTVRLPAVVRMRPDGTPGEVVIKGLVE